MGVSTDGILAYGYDLGGEASDWKVAELAVGSVPWADPDAADYDGFIGAAEAELARKIPRQRADNYRHAPGVAPGGGVEIVYHRCGETSDYILAAWSTRAARGYPVVVDLAALLLRREAEDWDGRLRRALDALGLTPPSERPAWLLVSYWG